MQCSTKNSIFVFLSFALFLIGFYSFWTPLGWDLDEAAILWNSVRVLSGEQSWSVYAPEFTRWELFLGNYYAIFDALGLPVRSGPVLLRLLELSLLIYFLKLEKRSLLLVLVASIWFSFNPWNLYYGDVLGTCVGVGIWVLIMPRLRTQPMLYALVGLMALMHYTSLRLLLGWELILLIRSRRWISLSALGLSGLFFAVILLVTGQVEFFLQRGSYNLVDSGGILLFQRWISAVLIPILPLSADYQVVGDAFMGDFVHEALRSLQTSRPLVGWGAAILFVLGLCGRFLKAKRVGLRNAWTERDGLLLFLWIILSFLGPSASRLLILQGLWTLFLVEGWGECLGRCRTHLWRRNLQGCLMLLAAFVLWEGLLMLKTRQSEAHQNLFYFSRYESLEKENQEVALLVSDYGFPVARWVASRSNFLIAAPSTNVEILDLIVKAELQKKSPLKVYLDEVPAQAHRLTGYDQWQSLRESEVHLKTHYHVRRESWVGLSSESRLGFMCLELE